MNLSSAAEVTGSSFTVAVVMRGSFIKAHDGFCNCTWKTFKVIEKSYIDWPSCLNVMMHCRISLLIWAVLAIIWTWSFTKYIFFIPPLPCHNTTDWLKRIKKGRNKGTAVNLNAFQVTTSWSWLRECQECAKLSSRRRVATLKNLNSKIYFDLFNTFLVTKLFHMC